MAWRIRRLQEVRDHPRRRREPPRAATGDRVLVTGWFSWPHEAVTAGDLLARDVACEWLREAGREYDVANAPIFGPGVDWRAVDPADYSDAIFVCGPVESGRRLDYLIDRFGASRWTALNVTMIRPLESWNPFERLFERDSSARERPDLAFVAGGERVPLVGVVLIEPYGPQYPDRDRQVQARAAITELLDSRPVARVPIDTRLKDNEGGLRSPAEVESAIAGMDVVVTTRLHGMVLALKHGVPALAIDPVEGGSKITQQAAAVGWPVVNSSGEIRQETLGSALDFCLTDEARALASECAARARTTLAQTQQDFVAAFAATSRARRAG